ncbi:DciA family protein [Streptomyces javensis]|uniref:DUF721 domain-containing protein n=1 Tax=Streptomyces javensis TaxID=114698 RepID=A0ABS0R2X9_9ACTN|nr:DciA family protein [Streptomyces javensis]MBI0311653.1 DUF721 domain-containing protein [Streptomyces javensis]
MTTEQVPGSGADLARIALRQAKEAARRAGLKPKKERKAGRRKTRGDGRDPVALGSVMQQLTVDQGWQRDVDGGNLVNRWATLVGADRAAHWRAIAYDERTRTLTVACDSDAWAATLRLSHRQVVADVNRALGGNSSPRSADPLARIEVRKGAAPALTSPTPAMAPPVPTRAAPPGAAPPTSGEYVEIRERLRAERARRDAEQSVPSRATPAWFREPQTAFREAQYVQEAEQERVLRAADTHSKALQRARAERAGRSTPAPQRTRGVA